MAQRVTKIYPITQPRRMIINRQSAQSGLSVSSSSSTKASDEYAISSDPELLRLRTSVGERIDSRGKQKEQMSELNERLADYVEKVRFLDAQNRRLGRELEVLRDRHGRETDHVRARYECEVKNLQDLVHQSEAEKITAEANLRKASDDLNGLKIGVDEIYIEIKQNQEIKDRLNQQLADFEGEMALLKRRSGAFDDVKKRNKAEIARLRNEEARLKKDLESEVQGRFKAQLEATYLKDVMEAVEAGHVLKWQEIANRVYRDSTAENREAWSSEFKAKFKKIQDSYEERVQEVTQDVTESLTLKLRQNVGAASREQFEMTMIKTETTATASRMSELNNRISSLNLLITQQETEISSLTEEIRTSKERNELEISELRISLEEKRSDNLRAKEELQRFFDMKISTEVELAAYKRLLESEAVAETLDFVDSGKFYSSRELVEAPRYFSCTKGSYLSSSSFSLE